MEHFEFKFSVVIGSLLFIACNGMDPKFSATCQGFVNLNEEQTLIEWNALSSDDRSKMIKVFSSPTASNKDKFSNRLLLIASRSGGQSSGALSLIRNAVKLSCYVQLSNTYDLSFSDEDPILTALHHKQYQELASLLRQRHIFSYRHVQAMVEEGNDQLASLLLDAGVYVGTFEHEQACQELVRTAQAKGCEEFLTLLKQKLIPAVQIEKIYE